MAQLWLKKLCLRGRWQTVTVTKPRARHGLVSLPWPLPLFWRWALPSAGGGAGAAGSKEDSTKNSSSAAPRISTRLCRSELCPLRGADQNMQCSASALYWTWNVPDRSYCRLFLQLLVFSHVGDDLGAALKHKDTSSMTKTRKKEMLREKVIATFKIIWKSLNFPIQGNSSAYNTVHMHS